MVDNNSIHVSILAFLVLFVGIRMIKSGVQKHKKSPDKITFWNASYIVLGIIWAIGGAIGVIMSIGFMIRLL